jgi:polygalacturonase
LRGSRLGTDSCVEVTLDRIFIVSGEDSVTVKATNFGMRLHNSIKKIRVIKNVMMTVNSSLKIGTETQARHIHDILFENNDILTADHAFTLCLRDGALIENVIFHNNRVEMADGCTTTRTGPSTS